MDTVQIGQFISTIGFPCFVAVWLLIRSDKKEEKTHTLLTELKTAVEKLSFRGFGD